MVAGTTGSAVKQAIFRWCVGIGKRVSTLQQQRQPVPGLLHLQYKLAHKLVFHKLHQTVGGRLRFFSLVGRLCPRKSRPSSTPPACSFWKGTASPRPVRPDRKPHDHYKFGTVGMAFPGVEIRLAPDGEILARGPNIAKGYYKRPQETAEVFRDDGWFATGDIGELDEEGFLRITDRKKDLIVTSGGKNIAPQNIENLLKTDRYISQAMVYGDRRNYLTAILTLDMEEVGSYAREHGIQYNRPEELASHPHIQRCWRVAWRSSISGWLHTKPLRNFLLPRRISRKKMAN
jgi:long-chain acyl-CoA synthetase